MATSQFGGVIDLTGEESSGDDVLVLPTRPVPPTSAPTFSPASVPPGNHGGPLPGAKETPKPGLPFAAASGAAAGAASPPKSHVSSTTAASMSFFPVVDDKPSPSRPGSRHSPMLREESPDSPISDLAVSSPEALTPSPVATAKARQTPPVQTPKIADWTTAKIEAALNGLARNIQTDHARLVHYTLQETSSQGSAERPHLSAIDDFADMKPHLAERGDTQDVLKIKLKQHGREHQRGKQELRESRLKVVSIKTNKESVPKYRFHHVEISKNILSPNTPLMFIPHLKDLEDGSEDKQKFNQWIEELESMDKDSGFDTSARIGKWTKTRTAEYARMVSLHVDRWISRLGIDGCNKSTLIRYMASRPKKDDAITPQQKHNLLNSYSSDIAGSPRSVKIASMFTTAFNRVFQKRKVTLDDVLLLDESVENIVDQKKLTKDATVPQGSQKAGGEEVLDGAAASVPAGAASTTGVTHIARDDALVPRGVAVSQNGTNHEDLVEQVQWYLGTYTVLGCLICYAHSCEHGEFGEENFRRCFSIDDTGSNLARTIHRRHIQQAREQKKDAASKTAPPPALPCDNKCYRSYDVGDAAFVTKAWTEDETNVLRSMFLALGSSPLKTQCAAAVVLGRYCWEVYRRMKELKLALPQVEVPADVPNVRPLTWYDRHRKVLLGDWQDHTYTHEHALREQKDPCHHDGPCSAARGCPCVETKVLCERFCACTAETCAYKFTGCACHGSGKTCYQRQKEGKPCICVQLNRECDPVLCGGCGAKERADPRNRYDDALHSTGCQNVAMQRGLSKITLMGKSQLQGCGYGLFTAEDISADEFIFEYIGELISHDEGVRREARRGDVFNQESNASYLFTLLDKDGIWVDAAIYGNLSRYVNHASEHDKKGCNISPKILLVNGEFRIKFSALRDIKVGEELFFNYGENFPNLTKKLLEDKADGVPDGGTPTAGGDKKGKRRAGRPPKNAPAKADARKTGANGKRNKQDGARKEAPPVERESTDAADQRETTPLEGQILYEKRRRRGRKRKRLLGDEEEEEEADEWQPGAKDSDEDGEYGRRPNRGGRGRAGAGGGRRGGGAAAKKTAAPVTAAAAEDDDDSDADPDTPSKRKRRPRKKAVASTSRVTDNAIDSDEQPLMKTTVAASSALRRAGASVTHATTASRKDGTTDMDPPGQGQGQGHGRHLSAQQFYGTNEDDEDMDADVDVMEGSRERRERRKPARYRSDEW